jgi:hypothetical protein
LCVARGRPSGEVNLLRHFWPAIIFLAGEKKFGYYYTRGLIKFSLPLGDTTAPSSTFIGGVKNHSGLKYNDWL